MGVLFCRLPVGAKLFVDNWGLRWCHQTCHTETLTCLMETCAKWLPQMSQRVQSCPNPHLGYCAAHLADARWRARLPPQRTPAPHPVAPRCRLLSSYSSSWSPGARLRHRLGTARWLTGSDGPSQLETSSAFLLLTGSCGDSREVTPSLSTLHDARWLKNF